MEYIQIPLPDFSFTSLAEQKAKDVCGFDLRFDRYDMQMLARNNKETVDVMLNYIEELGNNEDKITFIGYILNYLTIESHKLRLKLNADQSKFLDDNVNRVKYFFYKQASKLGYNFDKNAFSEIESSELDSKLNDILDALNKLQVGQELLYDEFEQIKEQIKADFESLKTDKPLGKKRFFKIALGTIGSYTGNKIADEIFSQLRPSIIELLKHQAPHLLNSFIAILN